MAKPRKPPAKPSAEDKPKFTCDFCKKSYARENTFLVHMCEKKTRFLNRDEKYVKLGFAIYLKFYSVNYRGRREQSYDDFMNSTLYTAFTKFGRYLLTIHAIQPMAFAEFLIRTELPISKWESPVVYENYVRELSKRESAEAAVERNILLMQQWSMDTGLPWTEFFRQISPSLAVTWIRSGRISPWVLFTASSSPALMDRLSVEQMSLIQSYVDPGFWGIMLDRHGDDVDAIRQVLAEAGV